MQRLFAAFLFLVFVTDAAPPASVYAPLMAYEGRWEITRKSAGANAKADELQNQCALVGKFFTCQQAVNGNVAALLVFVPLNQPGHFATQTVLPEGRATGRGELEISGNRWVFTSSWNQGATTTRYRTTNIFQDKNHIHFEQEESSDGTHWEVKDSGDDVRVSAAPR
jgi:hypothetical protein